MAYPFPALSSAGASEEARDPGGGAIPKRNSGAPDGGSYRKRQATEVGRNGSGASSSSPFTSVVPGSVRHTVVTTRAHGRVDSLQKNTLLCATWPLPEAERIKCMASKPKPPKQPSLARAKGSNGKRRKRKGCVWKTGPFWNRTQPVSTSARGKSL